MTTITTKEGTTIYYNEPHFDAEIAYAEFTDDGMVRHPSFLKLIKD